MRVFGLTPESVLARTPAAGLALTRSRAATMIEAGLSFGLVSVLAYSIWAFRLIPGTAPMYGTIAAVYLGLSGLALGRLLPGAGATVRFALLFAATFVVYAAIWCVFWFGLKGKYHADLYGAAVGLAAMTWMLQRAFGRSGGFLASFAVLFALHTVGYTLGDDLHALVRGTAGRLLWGAAHGVGFGLGLGYVVYECQEPLRTAALRLTGKFAA